MQQYQDLLRRIKSTGTRVENRTGIDTLRVETEQLKFDLRDSFPLITCRKIFIGPIIGELLSFIRGYTSAADFRRMGCNFWNQNANENQQWLNNPNRKGEDDLGRIYRWREFIKKDGTTIDQLAEAIRLIKTDPNSRRIIVESWNPGELDEMCLTPCHKSFRFITYPGSRELSMVVTIRSSDVVLGLPSNIAMYAILLHLVATVTGYTPLYLTMSLEDVHIYTNHLLGVDEMLRRPAMLTPRLTYSDRLYELHSVLFPNTNMSIEDIMSILETISPDDIMLKDYHSCPPIKFDMAV